MGTVLKYFSLSLQTLYIKAWKTQRMSDKEEMASDGSLNITLTLRLLMHGKVIDRCVNTSNNYVF